MTFGKSLVFASIVAAFSLINFSATAQDTTATAEAAPTAASIYNLAPGTVLDYETKSKLKMVGPQTRSNDITFYETFTVLAKKGEMLTVLAAIDAVTTVGEIQDRIPVTRFSFELPVTGAGAMDTLKTSMEVQMPHPLWQLESFFPILGEAGTTTRSVAVPALQHIAELPATVTKSGDTSKLVISSSGSETQIHYDSAATLDEKSFALSDKLTSVTAQAPDQGNMTLFLELNTKRTGTSTIEKAKLETLTKDVAAGVAIANELSGFDLQEDKPKVDALLAKMDDYIKTYPDGVFHKMLSMTRDNLVQVVERTNNADKITDGREAPDFKAKTTEGKDISLSEFKGKVVLLDFWATWCDPCVREIPNLKAIHDEFSTQGLVIIGISADEAESDLTDFVKQRGMKWPQIYDGEGTSSTIQVQYGISMYPTMIVVNKEGKIITVPQQVRGEALTEFIGEVLAGKPPKAKQPGANAPSQGMGQPMAIPAE